MKTYNLVNVDTQAIEAIQEMSVSEAIDRNACLRAGNERVRWVADDGTHTI